MLLDRPERLRLSRAQDRDVRHSHASGYAQIGLTSNRMEPVMRESVKRPGDELDIEELDAVTGGRMKQISAAPPIVPPDNMPHPEYLKIGFVHYALNLI